MADDRCDLLCLDLPRAEAIRARLDPAAAVEAAAARAKALGDPTRLLLALALREGNELCVCDLAWIAGKADNLVGHHCARCGLQVSCAPAARARSSSTASPNTRSRCWITSDRGRIGAAASARNGRRCPASSKARGPASAGLSGSPG